MFLFIYFAFQSLMRGVGDVRTPMYIVLGTVLLNFAADPLFILGWGPFPAMGVAGAALATVLTQGLASVIGMGMLLSGRYGVSLGLRDLVPDFALIRRIVALGLPASVEQSTRALGMTVMTILAAGFGTAMVASYGIGIRILSFVIIPALGLQMATTTVVGQNVGAGKWDRVKRSATVAAWVGFGSMTAIGVVFFLAARPLTAAFVPDDPGRDRRRYPVCPDHGPELRFHRPAAGAGRCVSRYGRYRGRHGAGDCLPVGAALPAGLRAVRAHQPRSGGRLVVVPDFQHRHFRACAVVA